MRPPLRHMPKPCDPSAGSGACPFRVDAEPGEFTAARFEILADTAGLPGAEAPPDAPMFACHHTADGAPVACAGWLAVCGGQHMGVRIAVAERRIAPEALCPAPDGPDLFASYDEMATQQAKGIYDPGAAAASRERAGHNAPMIAKMSRPGSGVRIAPACEAGYDVQTSGSGGRDTRRSLR